MNKKNLPYHFLFTAALVAFSLFIIYPKSEDWSDGTSLLKQRIAALTTRPGIDLQGGTRMEYEVPEGSRAKFTGRDSMSQLLKVLSLRIDNLGVLEPVIESTGEFRFVIELPGVSNQVVQRVKTLMEKQGKLEFKLVANLDGNPALQKEDTRIQSQIPDIEKNYPIDGENVRNRAEQGSKICQLINQTYLSRDLAREWSYYHLYEERDSGIQDEFLLVENKVEISGDEIHSASSQPHTFGSVPGFTLKPEARQKFCRITTKHMNGGGDERRLAIILDGHLASAPGINSAICDGSAIIEGNFTVEEVEDQVNIFTSGSLPVVPSLLREETTGPSIGVAAQRAGILAAVLGMMLIIVFMFAYYLGAGVVANLALLVNAILLGGVLSFFQATLTLPGVAGLILTIGMAVDANILIYERIRDELEKGKTLAQSIANGFERAFVTIFDANVTTLITAAVLIWLGTGSVKGFAVTLMAGILTSMFSALYVTRIIFTLLESQGLLKQMKMLNLVGTPKIDFMRMSKTTWMVSLVFVLAGAGIFGARFGDIQGIDLRGGTAFRVVSEKPLTGAEIVNSLGAVNEKVNGWVASGEWATIIDMQVEPGAPAPEAPEQFPLAGVQPQGLIVDYDENRPEPPAGSFYEFMVRSRTLTEHAYELVAKALHEGGDNIVPMEITEKTEISSKIARETALNAVVAILFAIGAILVYITMRFEFQFGVGAIVALVHDVTIALGAIALFHATPFIDIEINLPMIAALLTIIGYSLNDTIIVYDRIREELKGSHHVTPELLNSAINQTLSRTLLTSLTTLFVIGILFVLNYGRGSIIEGFSFAMLIGIGVGTYSSIFIASPFLLFWQSKVKPSESSN